MYRWYNYGACIKIQSFCFETCYSGGVTTGMRDGVQGPLPLFFSYFFCLIFSTTVGGPYYLFYILFINLCLYQEQNFRFRVTRLHSNNIKLSRM